MNMMTTKEIPMNGLSVEVQGIIKHFADVLKSPTNYVATSLFAAVGAAAGKRLIIEDGAYMNYGQMYACLVGAPGAAKSPAMRMAMQPINEIDSLYYKEYRERLKEWKKDKTADKPTLKKIACDDVTTEKLFSILHENENGVILVCDELTDFMGNLNRYNNGDNTPKFTKIWSGDTVRIDRKGDESLRIENPFLSILTSTQPVNLPKIFNRHVGTGFISRWLFCLPNEQPAERVEPNPMYMNYWRDLIGQIQQMPEMRLKFGDYAKTILDEFDGRMEIETKYQDEHGQNEYANYVIKQCYTIRRLAGIIHLISTETDLINGNVSGEITLKEVLYAEELVKFYDDCAKSVIPQIEIGRRFSATSAEVIKMVFDKFEVKSISELARAIGKSQQYVSKICNS